MAFDSGQAKICLECNFIFGNQINKCLRCNSSRVVDLETVIDNRLKKFAYELSTTKDYISQETAA